MFWAVPISAIVALAIYLSIVGWARERRLERELFYDHEIARRMLEREPARTEDVLTWAREREAHRLQRWRDSLRLAAYVLVGAGLGMLGGLHQSPSRRYFLLGLIPLLTGAGIALFSFRRGRRAATAVMVLLLAAGLPAQSAPATAPCIGDPAPPLRGARWLKGNAVESWKPGTVYILDIWAPWCGPCLGGMQRLTDLQKASHGRVSVVGLTGPDGYGSTLAAAEKAVREKGAAIGYSIAWDEGHQLYDTWMAREKEQGWPWSFIIAADGRIAWTGHPEKIGPILDQILHGTYDVNAAARAYRSRCSGG